MHGDACLLSSMMITEQSLLQLCDMNRSQACSDVATFHIGALSLAHSILCMADPLLHASAPHTDALLHPHVGKDALRARSGLPDTSRDCTRSNKTCTAVWDSGLRTALEVGDDSTASADREDRSDHREDDEGHGLQINPHSSQKILVENDVIGYDGVNLSEMSDSAQGIPSVESDGSSPAANVQWEKGKALPPSMAAMRIPPPVPPKPRLKSPRESTGSHQGCTGPGKEVPYRQNSPTTGKSLNHELVVKDPGKGAISAPSNKQKPPELCQVIGHCPGFNHGSNNKPGKDCRTVAGTGSSECGGAASPKASPSLLRPCPPPKPPKLFTVLEAGDEISNLTKGTSSSASQQEEGPGNGKGKEKKKEDQVEENHFKVISVVAENSSQLGERSTSGSVPCAPSGQEAGRPGGGPTETLRQAGRVAPFPKPPRRNRPVALLHAKIQTPQAQSLDSGRRDGEACSLTKDAPVASVTETSVEAVGSLEEPREVQNVEIGTESIQNRFEDPLDGATDQGPILKMVDTPEERKERERQTGGQREEVGGETQEGGEMALDLFGCNHDNTEDQSVYEDVNLSNQEVIGSDGGLIISTIPVTFLSRGKGHMSPRTLNIYETVEIVNPSLLADVSPVKFVGSALDFSVQKYRIGLSRKRKHRPPWIRHFRQGLASSYLQVFPASVFYNVPAATDGHVAVTSRDPGTRPKPLVKIKMAARNKTKMKAAQPKDKGTNRRSAQI